MPRKTKESDKEKETLKSRLFPKKSNKLANVEKQNKVSTKEKSETLKENPVETNNDISKKVTNKSTKKVSNSTTKSTEKVTKSKSTASKTEKKKTSTKKATTSSSAKKTTSSKTTKRASTKSVSSKSRKTKKDGNSFSPEYYDLPYKYNKTVVKILAQTPNTLFIYWEISDEDREALKQKYGEYFFEITKPVLVVYNETLNYYFEIDINDFANSWYLHVNDSNCEYKIELGRRPIPVNYNYIPQYDIEKNGPIKKIETPYIYISSSNELETPNDHILFNKQNKIYFRNIKTNKIIERDIKDFPFIAKDNQFISIYELYEDLYKEEILNNSFNLKNPSSGNPGSGSLSSKFR